MAVSEVNLLFTGRGGKEGLDHHRTYSRLYEVITTSQLDDEQVVSNAAGIPVLGALFSADVAAVVSNLDVQQSDDSPYIWHVTVEYDTNPQTHDKDKPDNKTDIDGNTIDKTAQENPLDEPETWTLTFMDMDRPATVGIAVDYAGRLKTLVPQLWASGASYGIGEYVQKGASVYIASANGTSGASGPSGTGQDIVDGTTTWNYVAPLNQVLNNPAFAPRVTIANSAGIPFDPPPMVPFSRLVLSVTKNAPVATMEYLLQLQSAVNQFTWRGIPPRCAQVRNVTHDGGKQKNGISYVTTKWEIMLDNSTFDLKILDAGSGNYQMRNNPATGSPEKVFVTFGDTGGNFGEIRPMNGAGDKLDPDQPPVYLRFVPDEFRIIDFNTMLPF